MEMIAPTPSAATGRAGEVSIIPGPTRPSSVVVIGAGGHGRELADIVRATTAGSGVELLGIVDDGAPDRFLLAASRIRYLGSTDSILRRDVDVYIGVGDPLVRRGIDELVGDRSGPPLRHPQAVVGSHCRLDDGVVLAAGVVVTTNVVLGRHAHVNVAASISHDCRIGAYATICPGARLTGAVTTGRGVFVGTGAVVLPGISIGDDAVIGAGAVVHRDVAAGTTVSGVPARAH